MNVGNQRKAADALFDFAKGFGSLHAGHGHTHDVGARLLERHDLRQGGFDIAGFGIGHALHADRRITADRHFADHDFARNAARNAMNMLHEITGLMNSSVGGALLLGGIRAQFGDKGFAARAGIGA